MDSGTGLEFRPLEFTSSEKSLICDVCTGSISPYIIRPFQREIFDIIDNLLHPGAGIHRSLFQPNLFGSPLIRNLEHGMKIASSGRGPK
ncbi:hypothetical protein AVEN_97678-1 [Araneus ventricosus]|uniref:Uncharacterized protein n=1 Tax=Araneus ventricosus TaxID=182803 RepID=A0A4Y2GVM4_ARAVE|nr:hypothetical protein AVEN_97678-1 [Araneus ventricosus]